MSLSVLPASANCVTVRIGLQQFLKNLPDTLRSSLYAPREHKVPPASESWQKRKGSPEDWWIASSANALISSRSISKSNGRTRDLSL